MLQWSWCTITSLILLVLGTVLRCNLEVTAQNCFSGQERQKGLFCFNHVNGHPCHKMCMNNHYSNYCKLSIINQTRCFILQFIQWLRQHNSVFMFISGLTQCTHQIGNTFEILILIQKYNSVCRQQGYN